MTMEYQNMRKKMDRFNDSKAIRYDGKYFRLSDTDSEATMVVCPICATSIENDRSKKVHHYDYPCPTCKSYIYGWGAALYIVPASYNKPEYNERWQELVKADARRQMAVMTEIEAERERILSGR